MELDGDQDVVATFLRELLGGKEYSEAEATRLQIRRPSRLKTLFTSIVGVLDEAQQIRALEALISLVRSSCGNVEACSTTGLQREILSFLSERGLFADPSLPHSVLKKLLRVFLYLAYHSVNIDDIRAMLAVFRSLRMVHEEPDDLSVSYYLSTLEMVARDSFGPASFFDLNGEFSGLMLPVLPSFPNNGYTFCAWLKFELLPETAAPLFTFCGKSGVGVMCSFVRSSLMITSFDKRKNDGHVEVPDLITPGRWHFLCITHTHRQIRGSKLDVYLNAELRQSVRLAYPNTALMMPVVKAYLAMRESNGANALRVLLGPTALFGQALPANIINNIRSVDEYDALVFQFNSYISSSSTSSGAGVSGASGAAGGSSGSGNSSDGLLVAYDARHCDRLKGLCYDSSGNEYHAAAASAGVRLRHAGTFKQAVAQLGGPLICLPLLVTSTTAAVSTVKGPPAADSTDEHGKTNVDVQARRNSGAAGNGGLTTQFDEDADFLKQMSDLIARPMGIRCIPKVVLLIAEIMRHSLVNKFIFRRSQGVRLMALLMRSLPPQYLTSELLTAVDRLRSAVISDRILSEEIYKFLLFNFRVWVNAPVELQCSAFDKLEIMTRKDSKNLSPAATRHFLRTLTWIYWRVPTDTTLRRARDFSAEEIDLLRKRVLAMIKIVLCESPPPKAAASVMASFSAKGKEVKSQLSYESTRALIFCMIGKPSNPMLPGMNVDGTPVLQENGQPQSSATASATVASSTGSKNRADVELEGTFSVVENVPEADLPDLLQLLIELSVQPTAPAGLLDLFGRLGGLRIWLPLLEFSSDVIRVMTLRLLRTYLFLKCECTQDREKANSPDKIHLSVGDAYLIMNSLKPEERPVSMGVYSEILLMILGIQVTEKDMKALDGKTAAYDSLIDESVLTTATIWHGNMMPAFLGLVRASSVTIRMVAIRHLKIIFASSTPASAINRHVLIFGSISNMGGTATESSTTEQVPIIEAILSLRGDPQRQREEPASAPSSLFGIELHGCPGVPMSQLREMVLNTQEPDEVRVNALYVIIKRDDVDFVRSLLALHGDGDRKKQGVNASCFSHMSSRMKLALVELMSVFQPAGCVDFITLMSYDVISSMICLEVKTNEMAWFLLQDPFTTLSRFITSADELEMVVVSLLKTTLDKMNEMLSAEMNLRVNEGTPSRESILWRNAESLATLAAAVVLHYDPDTLGQVDPSELVASTSSEDHQLQTSSASNANSLVFWKCERAIWHEAELVDAILGIWQHFASHFHSDSDASFARRSSNARRGSVPSRVTESGMQSPPPLGASHGYPGRSAVSSGMLGFGFNLLPTAAAPTGPSANSGPVSGTPSGSYISARPHPGGPMRQILQLLLRSLYLVLISDDNEASAAASGGDGSDSDDSSSSSFVGASAKLRLSPNSVFFARINKLEYFINAMSLGHELAQFDSCFAPSRAGSNGMTISAGLVTASDCVKAAPGDETTLLLWLVPEIGQLIDRVRQKCWSESAVKLASILASLVPVPLHSSDELAALLARNDFATNNLEVRRRDGFYHEQMAHARDIRAMRRVGMFAEEAEEKSRAKAELARISRFTRSMGAPSSRDGEERVWLERVKAKDLDDWMKLRVLAKWGVRHVWGVKEESVVSAVGVGDGSIVGLWGDNEFWRVDIYTSSNWIRCRLLPDTDDTGSHHSHRSEYIPASLKSEMLNTMADELAMPPVDSIVMDDETFAASHGAADATFDEDEDEEYENHDAGSGGDGDGDADADGDDSGSTEGEVPGYVGLARRISDVGYLDDDSSPSRMDASGGSDGSAPRSMLRDRMLSSDSMTEMVDGGTQPDDAGPMSLASAPPPLSSSQASSSSSSYLSSSHDSTGATAPVATTTYEAPDFSQAPVRDRRAVSVDVATTVKSAKGRIGTISTRFSSGIMRLTGSARPAKSESTASTSSSTSSSSMAPAMSGSGDFSGSERGLQGVTEGVPMNAGSGTQMQTAAGPAEPTTAEEGEKNSPAGPTTPSASASRMRKSFPSKHEHWKTLSSAYRTSAYLVLPSGVLVHGSMRIGAATIVFEGERVVSLRGIADAAKPPDEGSAARQRSALRLHEAYVSQLKRRVWGVRVIRVIHRRRFLMDAQNGLELYFVDGSSCLFGLESNGEADLVYATLKERKPPCLAKWGKRLLTAERLFAKSKWTEMWMRREISNFEYLMALNVSAGRSYNDIAQYPVFPWVLKDYSSSELRLDDPDVYRDLRRPIGAQTPEAVQKARATYDSCDPKAPIPPFHYANPYSHMQAVLFFLIRLAPFTGAVLGSEEQQLRAGAGAGAPAFNSVAEAFKLCTTDERRTYELTPEFFYLPELLSSARNKTLARHFSPGQDVSVATGLRRDVELPPWASSPYDFVRLHRLALESDFVSNNLHHWIDLVFGCKQAGTPAVEALNAYHIACYPERLDLTTSTAGVRAKLMQRGTVPLQLFRKPHPARMTQDESLEARFPASHAMAVLSSRRQVRRHDLPSKHAAAVTSVRFSNALNHAVALTTLTGASPGLGSGQGMGAHSTSSGDHGVVVYSTDRDGVVLAKRYLNSVPDTVRSCPFSMVDVDQWWKLPAGCLVSEGVVFYEQMISCGYWDGSWRIHWAADGELLQRIAFHKKPILCMARSEDDFTGDLALAFGSEDCTVSVWALSKLSASRSRRLFLKKELPVGGLPWVLLYGHTSPVVSVALNVDLDVVVSASRENTLLLHSLRGATPLHALALTPGPLESSVVAHLAISALGDTLVHSITTDRSSMQRSGRYSRANSLFSDDKARLTLGEGSGSGNMAACGLSSNDVAASGADQQSGLEQQSELYLVSINGHVISHDKLVVQREGDEASEGSPALPPPPHLLLERGVLFTRSGEYLITACAGVDAAIEVRDAGMPASVVRRIECKRPGAELTSISMGQDERCIVCGYADGAVVAYALHFGVADGCKSLVGLDKQARERERAAIAQATKRDLLRNKRRDELLPAFMRANGGSSTDGLWTRQGRAGMPEEPFLTHMQERFALLKQNCVGGDDKYEELLRQLWHAIYAQQPFHEEQRSSTSLQSRPIAEGNLLDLDGDDFSEQPADNTAQELQFERVGESWSRLGFQRPDPTTDFRAGGMLSLHCLVYFASHYTKQAVRMVTSQVPGSHDNTYPWGPAGINVTCMVARLFWKFDGELVREQQANWPLFGDDESFYLLFSEVFVLFDYLWNEMNANYGSFSMVIQATSDRIMDVLEEARGDVHALLAELRSQSVSSVGKQRRPSSRSMEDFLTTINTNMSDASSAINEGLMASDGTSFLPSTPPGSQSTSNGNGTSSPRSGWSFSSQVSQSVNRLGLGSSGLSSSAVSVNSTSSTSGTANLLPDMMAPPVPAAAATTTPGVATSNTLLPEVHDPFAGNDIRGFEMTPPVSSTSTGQTQSDDPFACLM